MLHPPQLQLQECFPFFLFFIIFTIIAVTINTRIIHIIIVAMLSTIHDIIYYHPFKSFFNHSNFAQKVSCIRNTRSVRRTSHATFFVLYYQKSVTTAERAYFFYYMVLSAGKQYLQLRQLQLIIRLHLPNL